MTPKEKALELVEKYHKEYDLLFWDLSWIQAKQCALIAVDEILKILPTNEYLEDVGKYIENRERVYYKEVKQEIENL